tara:strand:+ start:1394 stop:3286 length:1893 start_codon:yes stop_codon:yes gene_type:complete
MAKGRTPYNDDSKLFKALTRLLSGPLIDRHTQTGRKLRRRHLDTYSKWFKSASGQQFKKSEYNPMTILAANMISNRNRSERYIDFDQMEYTPELASALDIYADEMTTHSNIQPMLQIKCANEEIKTMLSSLYHNVLNVNYNLFGWCRTMCKYGDLFLYLDIDENMGITHTIGLPPQEVERLDGEDKNNPNYIQYQWNSGGMTFENWQMAHFRILGNDKHAPYGTSVLEPARRIWRQLTLLEDAMMAYRIVRSPERRVFYIDVGNISPEDVEQYMQKVMTQMKRNQIADPSTGKVDLRYNPMSIEEDYFIPVRGGTSTKIENLAGGQFTGAVDDVKYLRDKLFAAIKIPQSYLTMGEGASEDKTTLAQKDIRFARTIQRLQRVVISELEKIGIIHLYTLGFKGDDLLSFSLKLNNPSRIAELQELEHWRSKFEAASAATEGFFSRRWIAEHMLGMSEEDFLRNQREMFFDKKFLASLEAVGQPAEGMAPGGDMGGEPGGLEDFLGDDETTGAAEDLGADLLGGDDEEDILLAAPPGKRDDKKRGPYKRHQDKYQKGKKKKNYSSMASPETFTHRKLNPGSTEMAQLGDGLMEKRNSNDFLEEEKLFNISKDITVLLESLNHLEKKDEAKAQ